MEAITGVPAADLRGAARLYASARNGAIYYGLGVTEHSQGSTMVIGIANLAMVTGNLGRKGVGVNPLRGQNNVQGSCDMGSFPHELPGYRHVSDPAVRALFENDWKRQARRRAGPAHSEHVRRLAGRLFPGHVRAGRGPRAVRSRHAARDRGAARRWSASSCRTSSSTRRRSSRTSSCPAPASWRRTARSPTPNAASRACARSCRRSPAWPTGRLPSRCRTRWAIRCTTTIRRRSWTRSRASRRPSTA